MTLPPGSIKDRPLETQSGRLARMYLVLSRTNRAMDQATDTPGLLDAVCRTIVDAGGFRMCWIGFVGDEDEPIRPMASAGYDDGYLDFVQIRLHGARSEGPTGQALRLRRTVICDDIATDPRMGPWRREALRRGYRSSVGLSLCKGDNLLGVLTVYADTPRRFDTSEIELLEELGRDLSLALSSIAEERGRRRAEAALTVSESRFQAAVETLLDPFAILRAVRDPNGRVVDFVYEFANESAQQVNRMPAGDRLVGRRLLDLLPAHESSGLLELYAHAVDTGEAIHLDEMEYEDVWGGERSVRYFDIRASSFGDSLVFTWRDVTERRETHRRRAEELERRVRERTAELEIERTRALEVASLSTAMLAVQTPQEAARLLLDTVCRISGALDGLVVLGGSASAPLREVYSFGLDRPAIDRGKSATPLIETPIRQAIRTGEPVVIDDTADLAARFPELMAASTDLGNRSRLALPMRVGALTIGGLTVGFQPRKFDRHELTFFDSLASATAQALERLRLAQAEQEARGILDAVVAQMPVGVDVVGKDGRLLYRNAEFDRLLLGSAAEPPREDSDRSSWLGFRPDGRRYSVSEWPVARSLAGGELVVDEEIKVMRGDRTSVVIAQTSAPIRDSAGEIVAAVGVSVDITDRKEMEHARDAFLGVLSHELRTPVTTIHAAAQFLAGRGETQTASVRQELAGDILAESDRLGRMVDDLLVLARAERGVDMSVHGAALVQHRLRAVVSLLSTAWPDRRFAVQMPDDMPPVRGDDSYLDHVLRNLLGNAAKYGRCEVSAMVTVRRDGVTVDVLDDGPGIPEAEQEHVFELFHRAPATSHLPGAGIGLYVVRRLAEAMGGTVSVANRPEGGAIFSLTLPRYVEAEAIRSERAPRRARKTRRS